MEPENSVILESCAEDSMLIQTVKNIVNQNERNELEGEEEFFLVTDVQDERQSHLEVSSKESTCTMSQAGERLIWTDLCRVCASANDHLIPIFEGEGAEHELCNKIHKYLPIHVSESDTLPLQLCYHCAATLLAWHELAEGCLNAERRLLEIQDTLQDKHQYYNPASEELEVSTQVMPTPDTVETLSEQQTDVKEACGDLATTDSDRWQSEYVVQMVEIQGSSAEDVKYIECAQCSIIIVSHMNAKQNAEMHYCPYCKVPFRSREKNFQEHILRHDATADSLKHASEEDIDQRPENVIDKLFLPKGSGNESVLQERSESYTCNLCEKTFGKKSELKRHINIHSNIKRIQNPDEADVVSKAKQVVDDRVSYKCDECKKLMFTKRGFLRHIRVHSDKRPCKCDLCGKCYRIEQDLARHIRDVHEGLKKYACDICGRAFANKGAKDDHRRIHTGERPYACEHCPKTFRTLNSIYIHNRVHTNYKPHKCSYCNKYFRSRQMLNNHETTHTGVKAFSCEICGKSFSVKGEVMRHRAIHNEEKPYECRSCDMKFSQKRYLRNHIKQHHKEQSSLLLAELLENN